MRITAIHRYFWPDVPPYASILRAMTEDWADAGHEVRVLTTQPSYGAGQQMSRRARRERVGDLAVERLPVIRTPRTPVHALVNFVGFPVLAALRVLTSRRADMVMCATAPPVLLGFLVSAAAKARGSAFVYHCMDLHPEVGAISGEFRNPLVYAVLRRMEIATMSRARTIVVLSEDMKASVAQRRPELADKVEVINNFALPDFSGQGVDAAVLSRLDDSSGPERVRVVFTGNLGRFQGLEDIIGALNDLPASPPVELVFMGDGKARPVLARAAEDLSSRSPHRVMLLPQSSPATARALMASADAGIVSLVPGIVKYAYPSKTATYLEEGLSLLVICDPESELARTVAEAGLGHAAAPGDLAGVVAALSAITAESTEERASRAGRLREYYERTFADDTILERWRGVLQRLV